MFHIPGGIPWLDVQYAAGERVGDSFEDWEIVDALTCFKNKLFVLPLLNPYPFTKANECLQMPIQDLFCKFLAHLNQKL